ncbi:hypothetical protein B0H63DRAFT_508083 [Podospora didyma]|uniref:Uncharacterized protein n=1 Tax=Podospora didyma TaxID=330526 RepID=A0AAE0P062_9PEZI|nr:hypothetical protein B0H63DRAFT_508083 [Podospora didyma]
MSEKMSLHSGKDNIDSASSSDSGAVYGVSGYDDTFYNQFVDTTTRQEASNIDVKGGGWIINSSDDDDGDDGDDSVDLVQEGFDSDSDHDDLDKEDELAGRGEVADSSSPETDRIFAKPAQTRAQFRRLLPAEVVEPSESEPGMESVGEGSTGDEGYQPEPEDDNEGETGGFVDDEGEEKGLVADEDEQGFVVLKRPDHEALLQQTKDLKDKVSKLTSEVEKYETEAKSQNSEATAWKTAAVKWQKEATTRKTEATAWRAEAKRWTKTVLEAMFKTKPTSSEQQKAKEEEEIKKQMEEELILIQNLKHYAERFKRRVEEEQQLVQQSAAIDVPCDKSVLAECLGHPYSYGISDEKMGKMWRELNTKVQDLLVDHFTFPFLKTLIDDERVGPVLRKITAHPERCVGHKLEEYQLLLEYVWHQIYDTVFATTGKLWSGKFGPPFFEYFDMLQRCAFDNFPEFLPEVIDLRARIATILDRLHGDPNPERNAKAITEIFWGKRIAKLIPDEKKQDSYLSGGLEVVELAVKIDIAMRRFKPHWHISRAWVSEGTGRRFRRGVDGASPAAAGLHRWGDETGKNYPNATVRVVKGKVTLDDLEPPKPGYRVPCVEEVPDRDS